MDTDTKTKTKTKRVFLLEYPNSDGNIENAKLSGFTPKLAAHKALSILAKNNIIGDENPQIEFKIKEVTKESRGLIYNFTGKRTKLNEPAEIKLPNGKTVTYTHWNEIVQII